jgi:ABC-type antimicrobial peptide transport system permease subunit
MSPIVVLVSMYFYAFQRISRSWALFVAFFLGLTLAVSLFTGTLIGTDAIGNQTVQTALNNMPVDLVASKSISGKSANFTSANIDASLASISSIQGITHDEAMYRISTKVLDVNKNFTASLPSSSGGVIALSDNSVLLKDAVFSNGSGTLGINQTLIEEGSGNSSRYSLGDTVTLKIRVQNQTMNPKTRTYETYYFTYNLTLANKVQLSDSAFSIAASTSASSARVLLQQLILGTQLRKPSYSMMIIDNRTLFIILTAIYNKNSLPTDAIGIELLTWFDRNAVVKPWDIAQSIADVQTIQNLINNNVRRDGYTPINLLTLTLTTIQQLILGEEIVFIVLALPVFFTAWYMGRTVSDVSLNLRRREIGLLQTKGFSKNQILRLFLTETIVLGLIASALGIVIGAIILPFANLQTSVLGGFQLLDAYNIALAIVFGVMLAVISVFSPARKAANMKTVDAVREYSPGESESMLKIRWPLVSLILGSYKIAALAVGFNLSAYTIPARNLFITILFGIAVFIDRILGYVAPILFFWGFSRIFIQGSFKLQELIGKISSRLVSGLGEIATKNARLNTKRTAAVAFLLALIVGYGVSVIGGLASTDDYRQRSVYVNVGADISVQMFSEINATLVKSQIDNLTGVSSSTIERWISVPTSFGTIQARVIDPLRWQNTAYYEPNWFIGTDASNAINKLAVSNQTIILDESVVGTSLVIGQNITVDFGTRIYSLTIVGFFGVQAASIPTLLGLTPVAQQSTSYWSYIPESLYEQSSSVLPSSTRILVKEVPGTNGTKLAEEIETLNSNIKSVDSVDTQMKLIENNIFLSGPRRVQALGVPFAALTASVGVALLETTTLRERKKEITLTAVRGFSYMQIVKAQLLENLGIIIFSILLGTLVGYVTTMGNVQSQNTTIALVERRVVFPPYSILTVLAIIGIILASIIMPILIMTRRYSKSLEWRIRG